MVEVKIERRGGSGIFSAVSAGELGRVLEVRGIASL